MFLSSVFQGTGVYSGSDCYENGLNHAVLLVGYNILAQPPYWIIRNSWGSKWGHKGHMKLAISGGVGTCGINLLPGYIPAIFSCEFCSLFL